MKRPRAAPSSPAPPRARAKPRLTSLPQAGRRLGLSRATPHPFFDGLPEDALVLIVQRLSTAPSPGPTACPLLSLARVSPGVRAVIAATVGARLAFSVYGHSDWFWAWLAIAGPCVRELALHNRSYRSAGDVRHLWAMWPRRPVVQLDSCSALSAVRQARAPLKELDVSGLQSFRRAGLSALEKLLMTVRATLRSLKVDLTHFRIAHAVQNATLVELRRLVVVNVEDGAEEQILPILRSMESSVGEGCQLKELWLDVCEDIPTIFRQHREEIVSLLPRLESFHIDYDDELQNFSALSSASVDNLCAVATLPTLQRVCFSGSGVPVTQRLISEIREKCVRLTDLRLIDCDVDPNGRPGVPSPAKACNEALTCTGNALTHYYPRWVTFKLDQLDTLAKHCHRLTHLRIFTAPGAEDSLLELGRSLSDSVVDLEVYPKKHEKKREVAGSVVRLIQGLNKLERVCLVTLDLSTNQLKGVLEHCGKRLKLCSFSPPAFPGNEGDETAESIADVVLTAAGHNPNLQRLECIFQDDTVPKVKSRKLAGRLKVAINLLEARATRLESGNIAGLVRKMVSCEGNRGRLDR